MILFLGLLAFLLATLTYADSTLCHSINDANKQEICFANCTTSNNAAQQNICKGMHAYTGKVEDQDYEKAHQLFSLAANTGNTHAYELLADLYAKGQGTKKDYVESVKWHRKAANNGKYASHYALGNFYLTGTGVKKDEKQAFKWFEKAARGSEKNAYLVLGLMYYKGTGVEKNLKKSYRWFKKSARAKNPKGQYYTGIAYLRGEGVTRDIDKGIHWLEQSKKNGSPKAGKILAIAKKIQQLEMKKASIAKKSESNIATKDTAVTTQQTETNIVTKQAPRQPIEKPVARKAEPQKVARQPGTTAKVFDPPSNVRYAPGKQVMCQVRNVKTIRIGRGRNGWYPTDVCGKEGYIHRSQIRVDR